MSLPSSLLPNTSLPRAQFRAIVACGFGSELYPLVEPVHVVGDDNDTAEDSSINETAAAAAAAALTTAGTSFGATEVDMTGLQLGQGASSHRKNKQAQTKALLPVGGRKMVDWVLDRVEEAGVFGEAAVDTDWLANANCWPFPHHSFAQPPSNEQKDILVLTPESISGPMAHHLRARRSAPSTSSPSAKVDLEEVPDETARRGLVEIVKWAAAKTLIKSDFILLPCDLLLVPATAVPTISLASLLDRHRTDDNLMTTLFTERAAGNVVDPRKDGPPEILTVYDEKTSTLLDIRELDDYDEDEVPLRTSMLSNFPSPTVTTALLPTQLYVFSHKVLPALSAPEYSRRLRQMENIREFAAWVCRLAWRGKGSNAIGQREASSVSREDGLAMGRSTTQAPLIAESRSSRHVAGRGRADAESTSHTGANTPALLSRAGSNWRQNSVDFAASASWGERSAPLLSNAPTEASKHAGTGGCKVVIWRSTDGWAGRGNTVAGYVEMCRASLKLLPPNPPPSNTPSGVFVSADSHVHASAFNNMGEKVGIKRCIVGKNCHIGKGTKLTNVVMMDNVHLGENVKLENCVVSDNAQIRDRASLKDCELGRDVIVDFDAQLKGEQLTVELD
ncbi:Translation initiation factor eIF-2B subunit gamma [Microbotryomycetes sp. JL201]|nr:Translation initiation factor eIF-2B subunit gamma [Microbotryomycetes sp. JL201]